MSSVSEFQIAALRIRTKAAKDATPSLHDSIVIYWIVRLL